MPSGIDCGRRTQSLRSFWSGESQVYMCTFWLAFYLHALWLGQFLRNITRFAWEPIINLVRNTPIMNDYICLCDWMWYCAQIRRRSNHPLTERGMAILSQGLLGVFRNGGPFWKIPRRPWRRGCVGRLQRRLFAAFAEQFHGGRFWTGVVLCSEFQTPLSRLQCPWRIPPVIKIYWNFYLNGPRTIMFTTGQLACVQAVSPVSTYTCHETFPEYWTAVVVRPKRFFLRFLTCALFVYAVASSFYCGGCVSGNLEISTSLTPEVMWSQ